MMITVLEICPIIKKRKKGKSFELHLLPSLCSYTSIVGLELWARSL